MRVTALEELKPGAEQMRVDGTTQEMGVTVRVLRSASELEEVRDVWQKLCTHPNSELDFFLAVIHSKPEILRPHVTVLTRDGVPEALLVGRIEDTVLQSKLGYLVLQRSRVRRLTIVYEGLLGDFSEANANVMARALTNALADSEAEVVWFNSLRSDSALVAAATEVAGRFFNDYFVDSRPHWRARLAPSYGEFFRGLSSNTRHNLKRYSSRLLKAFPSDLEVRCFCSPDELDRILADTEQVASKTYHRGLGVGFIHNAETRRLTSFALANGRFRAYILYIAGRPCAFWNGVRYGNSFFTGTTGNDPAYREHRLGTFLLTKVFEDLCQSGLDYVDFGFGDAQYKQDFCGDNWDETSFYLFAPSIRGILLNCMRTPILAADRLGRAIVARAALSNKIKRSWRASLTRQEDRAQ
jgi:hypothetical protein